MPISIDLISHYLSITFIVIIGCLTFIRLQFIVWVYAESKILLLTNDKQFKCQIHYKTRFSRIFPIFGQGFLSQIWNHWITSLNFPQILVNLLEHIFRGHAQSFEIYMITKLIIFAFWCIKSTTFLCCIRDCKHFNNEWESKLF